MTFISTVRQRFRSLTRCDSIFDVVLINHAILKLFGLTIYSVQKRSDGYKTTITPTDLLALLRLLVMEGFVFYVCTFTMGRIQPTGSNIMDNAIRYSFLLSSFLISALSIGNYLRYGQIWNVWEKLDRFDQRAIEMNAPIDHGSHKRQLLQSIAFIWFSCILLAVLGNAALSVDYGTLTVRLAIVFSFFCFNIPFGLINNNIFFTCQLVYRRLEHINEVFAVHFLPPKKLGLIMLNELPDIKNEHWDKTSLLQMLATQWDEMGQVTRMINSAFWGQIVYISTTNMMVMTLSEFSFYRTLITEDKRQRMMAEIYLQNGLFYEIMLVAVIGTFDAIKRQAEKTAVLVHKATREVENLRLQDALQYFSQQINYRPIVVSCGYFVCDWTMGMMIIGTVASYVVILVQFDDTLGLAMKKRP
ncbi:uncharacterized protein LOC129729120 [Wyeomyia smithii]|uniref:uncharacterized protein LOC129729120 n=1 Tax=Wyeomyia smithii TaxID=174621 RepID=UPI002467C00D|nr:uncharacterized protein LOC129729120 [Wyeomyia smithii]